MKHLHDLIDDYANTRAMQGHPLQDSTLQKLHKNLDKKLSAGVVEITDKHNAKMEGMISISTYKLMNPLCSAHCKCDGSICQHCYVDGIFPRALNLIPKLINNTHQLTTRIIPTAELPVVNAHSFRIESFADVMNVTQCINYINLCHRNPRTTFTAWTKNPQLWDKAFKEVGKPENLIMILSGLYMVTDRETATKNTRNLSNAKKRYAWIDKTFTVYGKEYATDNHIDINCGALHCLTCGKCYQKNTTDELRELQKRS